MIVSLSANGPCRGAASSAITRLLAKKAKSNWVASPTALPGIGINRAVSGLSRRKASAARSNSKALIASLRVSPANGIVSSPVPHTAEYISRSFTRSVPSAARLASVASSSGGRSKPLKPTLGNCAASMPGSARPPPPENLAGQPPARPCARRLCPARRALQGRAPARSRCRQKSRHFRPPPARRSRPVAGRAAGCFPSSAG